MVLEADCRRAEKRVFELSGVCYIKTTQREFWVIELLGSEF